jgi:hypothetical protein
MNEEIIKITHSLATASVEEVRKKLIPLINDLINHDFNALLQLLYRIDVSEKKLKLLLKENQHHDAASIIADEIIMRQLQKLKTRSQYNPDSKHDENKW